MATYKVPQDVEADDKLIGPFSFRQFLYLLIVAGSIAIGWLLAQLFVGLAIIVLPVVVFFGALALPLRKDQPMEIYMAAIVSFYLKPRMRLWDPEGVETTIQISAPKTIEYSRTKDLSESEAVKRLSYLADIVDSGGWAIRGVSGSGTAMNSDVMLEAQGAVDVLDTHTSIAQNFDHMMQVSTDRMHAEARERMLHPEPTPAPVPAQQPMQQQVPQPIQQPGNDALLSQMSQQMGVGQGAMNPNAPAPHYDPYPTFHQSIIQPLNDSAHQAESDITPVTTPAPMPVSPQAPPVPATAMQATQFQPQAQTQPAPQQQPQTTQPTPTIQAAPQAPIAPQPTAPAVTAASAQLASQENVINTNTPEDQVSRLVTQAQQHASSARPAAAHPTQAEEANTTSDLPPSADIMNLANNPDLSIETIAHQANRLKKKKVESAPDEVVISLR